MFMSGFGIAAGKHRNHFMHFMLNLCAIGITRSFTTYCRPWNARHWIDQACYRFLSDSRYSYSIHINDIRFCTSVTHVVDAPFLIDQRLSPVQLHRNARLSGFHMWNGMISSGSSKELQRTEIRILEFKADAITRTKHHADHQRHSDKITNVHRLMIHSW